MANCCHDIQDAITLSELFSDWRRNLYGDNSKQKAQQLTIYRAGTTLLFIVDYYLNYCYIQNKTALPHRPIGTIIECRL